MCVWLGLVVVVDMVLLMLVVDGLVFGGSELLGWFMSVLVVLSVLYICVLVGNVGLGGRFGLMVVVLIWNMLVVGGVVDVVLLLVFVLLLLYVVSVVVVVSSVVSRLSVCGCWLGGEFGWECGWVMESVMMEIF